MTYILLDYDVESDCDGIVWSWAPVTLLLFIQIIILKWYSERSLFEILRTPFTDESYESLIDKLVRHSG